MSPLLIEPDQRNSIDDHLPPDSAALFSQPQNEVSMQAEDKASGQLVSMKPSTHMYPDPSTQDAKDEV